MSANVLLRAVLTGTMAAAIFAAAATADESVAFPDGRIKVTVESGRKLA